MALPAHAQKEAVIEKEKTWEEQFLKTNLQVSKWFDGVVNGVDVFLVGKRVSKTKSESSFSIDNTTTVTETENFNNTTSIAFRPRLQNLEEFMQLKFTTYNENEKSRGVENNALRTTQRRKNYGATLGFFRKLGNVRTTFQPRIELQDPLKVSHSLAFESVAESKQFSVNPKLEFFADADKGTGTFQAINFNYEFNPTWALTFINESEYQERLHQLFFTNGFSLNQSYSEATSFSYSWLMSSHNREVYHLQTHTLFVGWHQNIYRNILDFSLQPNMVFDKDNQFKGKSGIIFNISVNF
jgi:hypothetical protein